MSVCVCVCVWGHDVLVFLLLRLWRAPVCVCLCLMGNSELLVCVCVCLPSDGSAGVCWWTSVCLFHLSVLTELVLMREQADFGCDEEH